MYFVFLRCFFQAWLKPKSRIVITDYCLGTNESVQDHKMYLEKMKYNLVSVDDYLQVRCNYCNFIN